jgi:hypothetical protein
MDKSRTYTSYTKGKDFFRRSRSCDIKRGVRFRDGPVRSINYINVTTRRYWYSTVSMAAPNANQGDTVVYCLCRSAL